MELNKEAQEHLLKIFRLFKETLESEIKYANELIKIRKDYVKEIEKIKF